MLSFSPKNRVCFPPSALRDDGVRAVTLIELLVAVALLSILVALIYPAINKGIERASTAKCAHDMRQLTSALLASQLDYNGWFPPGYPARETKIELNDQQPGMPAQPGLRTFNFGQRLVPDYIKEVPICPGFQLTANGKKRYPNDKARLRFLGGGYGIHAIFLQWKMRDMPWPQWDPGSAAPAPYSAARMILLAEVGGECVTSTFAHQRQALAGIEPYNIKARSHVFEDALNFMFADGHLELVRRNDQREGLSEEQKSWTYPTNPNGPFASWGAKGRFIHQSVMNNTDFNKNYPGYQPPEE